MPLGEVVELIRRETGIEVSENQLSGLAAALARIAPGMDARGFLDESSDPLAGGGLIGRLIDEVTIQESYFFRETRELEAIDWHRLLALARNQGQDLVRVWVAACATGEEAYTLAILASEAFWPALPPVSILGTDISAAAIEAAAKGRFSERSQRNVTPDLLERYLTPAGSGYAVRESLRRLVRFRRHNLSNDPYPPAGEVPFEAITCRNVLIYLDSDAVSRTLAGLEAALRPGGVMILGAADRLTDTAGRLGRRAPDPSPPSAPRPWSRQPQRRPQRKRLRRPAPASEQSIADAIAAADRGDLTAAIAISDQVLSAEPLNADARFVRGLAELGNGDADEAVASFRRALYVDPTFALAAFQLGRAHDARGDEAAARRAYQQALRTFDPDDARHGAILDQVDIGDLAAACRTRLQAIGAER